MKKMPSVILSASAMVSALLTSAAWAGDCQPAYGVYHVAPRVNGEAYQLADMDGDGVGDLVSLDNAKVCRIYRNSGSGFALWSSVQLPAHATLASLKDFDGDGRTDILSNSITGQNCLGNLIRIFWNGGGSQPFAASQYTELPLPSSPYCVQSREIDFDGDGDLDVIMTSMAGNSRTYRNNGNRNFTVQSSFQWPRDLYYTHVKDYNGDGKADFVSLHKSGWADGQWGMYYYRGNGDGTFQPAVVNFGSERAAAGISINSNPLSDSREDVAVYVGNAITQQIRIGRWSGSNFAWTPVSVPLPFQVTESFDVNNDGFEDMVMVSQSGPNKMEAMLNDGHGNFSAQSKVTILDNAAYTPQWIRHESAGSASAQLVLAAGSAEVVVYRGACAPECQGDVNRSGTVDGSDLTVVLGLWGLSGDAHPVADIDGDGTIDGKDLAFVLSSWGACS